MQRLLEKRMRGRIPVSKVRSSFGHLRKAEGAHDSAFIDASQSLCQLYVDETV